MARAEYLRSVRLMLPVVVMGCFAACAGIDDDLGVSHDGVDDRKMSTSSPLLDDDQQPVNEVDEPRSTEVASDSSTRRRTSVATTSSLPSSNLPSASNQSDTTPVTTRPGTSTPSSGASGPSIPETSASETSTPQPATPSTSSPVTTAPVGSSPSTGTPVSDPGESTEVIENFESYAGSDAMPATWFNYGTAGGGVSIVPVSGDRVRAGQSGDNRMLAWGFDSAKSPGYGGVGKEFSAPRDWSSFTGLKFWLYGSGEGGQLQVEIGEDRTSDVERYRSDAFVDNQHGWRLIRIPFDSFAPASWNPAPGDGVLSLTSIANVVFAANSGTTVAGVAIDDVALYRSGGSSTTTTVPEAGSAWPATLVWSDEFNGSGINSANWRYDIGGWGWGNWESQYYTNRPENARVENGALIIEAHEEDYLGSGFTSARLITQNLREFQYGRVEARVKVPEGAGTWPAFWMLGTGLGEPGRTWPDVGEIDILEYVGREPNVVIGALHGPGFSGGGAIDQWSRQNAPIANDWHVVAVVWNYAGITWFLDGVQFHHVSRDDPPGNWVFDQPFFIILNLAIGGTLGGEIDPTLVFPLQYQIDYVRVYQ